MDHETMVLSPAAVSGPAFSEPGRDPIVLETVARSVVAPMDRGSLLLLIRQQIEFYFSDDNLPKDVFLLKQIEKDKTKEGFVSLKVLAGFPKMKRLTHDLGAIREAVEGSNLVILSTDGLSVKRKVALVLPEDTTEKRTLYVTRLPKDCDRESLMLVFSQFGTVIRLDLPMDKKTGEHKGMAFVEFQAEEQMRTALEAFTTNATKYKMVAKPFKSRNSKEVQPVNPKDNEKEDDLEEDAEDSSSPRTKDPKRNSGGKNRNSKEIQEGDQNANGAKRNSKEMKEGNNSNKEKRNSKEAKDSSNELPKRNSKEMKQESPEAYTKRLSRDIKTEERRKSKEPINQDNSNKDGGKRNSKDMKQGGEPKRTSKEIKKEPSKRTSAEMKADGTGREVPVVPDHVYESQNSFNQARARGARTQRNSKEEKGDWDLQDNRPKFHLKGREAAEERPLFVPIRNPLGPSPDGRGFSPGRGKIIIK